MQGLFGELAGSYQILLRSNGASCVTSIGAAAYSWASSVTCHCCRPEVIKTEPDMFAVWARYAVTKMASEICSHRNDAASDLNWNRWPLVVFYSWIADAFHDGMRRDHDYFTRRSRCFHDCRARSDLMKHHDCSWFSSWSLMIIMNMNISWTSSRPYWRSLMIPKDVHDAIRRLTLMSKARWVGQHWWMLLEGLMNPTRFFYDGFTPFYTTTWRWFWSK